MKKLMKVALGAWCLVPAVWCLVLGGGVAMAAELPAGYTAVEWIESTKGGKQFIDTGYTANGQTKVVFDAVIPARWEQNDRFGVLFGSRTMDVWAEKAFALQMCDGNTAVDTVRFAYNGAYRQDGGKPFPFGERVTVTCDGQHVEWTGSKAASVSFTAESLASSKSTLYIFADNTVSVDGAKSKTGLNHSVMRLYSFKIYEGGTLKRDFVPCFRTEDAAVGLYDTVEGSFCGNSGSGNLGVSDAVSPLGRELASGTYEITESLAFVAPRGESALKIAEGATVTLNIAAGVMVTLRGGDAVGTIGAGAGIEVPANATLKVTGAGKLVAYGGKAADGADGANGGNGSADRSTGNFTSGAGGAGGFGGGGAGAGIGGRGGDGGAGGTGGAAVSSYDWKHADLDGNAGSSGGNGGNGGTCGTVSIDGLMVVIAYGGAAGSDGAGGAAGTRSLEEGSTYWFSSFGGGGGGSGAKGGAAQDIGGGGFGGGGGGGGGSGAYVWGLKSTVDECAGWGAGGLGVVNGSAGGATSGFLPGFPGVSGSRGGSGTLTVADGAKVCAVEGRYSVGRLSGTVEIFYDNGQLLWVSGGTSSNLSYSVVKNGTGTLGTGWYVVNGTVSRTDRILVSGAANLVLLHNSSLTVDCSGKVNEDYAAGIDVGDDNSLSVFGVESGSLTAKGSACAAGIGTAMWHVQAFEEWEEPWACNSCGTVAIYGGTVTATGGDFGAGIGGGNHGAGGTVTINGGFVTACGDGSNRGADIGAGHGGAGGSLTIGPRVLKINDNHYREGVEVSFVIPQNLRLISARTDGGPLKLAENDTSRTVTFLRGQCLILTFETLDFECRLTVGDDVSFGPFFADAVIDASQLPKAVEAEKLSVDYALPNGGTARAEIACALYSTGVTMPIGGGAWYVVQGEVTTATLEVNGVANLILADGAKLTVNGGICVDVGATLNIYGQCAGTGQLIANGTNDDCAGIGGQNPKEWAGYGNCGAVTINGGMVTAMGGDHGAGIGGGLYGAGGTVTINGGEVTATGGEWGDAGIGGGASGHADGTVTLGENVEIIEGAVGKSSRYVKIGKVVDVLKTEVETFDSDWYVVVPRNVYVNTHFKPDSNTRVEMKVKVQGASEYWFGCWDGNWDDRAFALGNDGSTVYCGYGSGATCGGIPGIIPTGRVTVALEKGVVYTNDAVWSAAHQSDATFALTNNLYLFAQNRNGTVGVGGSQESIICYGCKISTNGVNGAVVPVRNFVPARTKDEQQIVGLYDTVSGEFFAARGGSLTLGYDEDYVISVTPGVPVVFDTAAEATNAMARAELKPSDRVAAVFGEDADAKGAYCAKFGFEVVQTAGGEWAVAALLKPEDWTKVVESAQEATRQLPVAQLAAMTVEGKRDVKVVGCVPGFYYTLYGARGLGALPTTETAYGPELCGLSGEVTFEKVAKPSDAAGFFSIGAKESPGVNPSDRVEMEPPATIEIGW